MSKYTERVNVPNVSPDTLCGNINFIALCIFIIGFFVFLSYSSLYLNLNHFMHSVELIVTLREL